MNGLYILEINPLSLASYAIIFSLSEDHLFILLIVSFALQKILSLIKFYFLILIFISVTLEDGIPLYILSLPCFFSVCKTS